MKPKKIKKVILKHSKNVQKIIEMYYEQKVFKDVVSDRIYERIHYVHHVEHIMNMFHINSMTELLVLLHWSIGETIGECKFCGEKKTRVRVRTKEWNVVDCRHEGICKSCDKPYESANKQGVCYKCSPYEYEHEREKYSNDPQHRLYRFLNYVGNPEYIEKIDNSDEADLMMQLAAQYHHWFLRIRDNLITKAIKENTA